MEIRNRKGKAKANELHATKGGRIEKKISVDKSKITKDLALKIIGNDLSLLIKSEKWRDYLNDEFKKDYFINLNNSVNNAYDKGVVYPAKELIFNAFNLTELENVIFRIFSKKVFIFDLK
jgi:hypothetical protein